MKFKTREETYVAYDLDSCMFGDITGESIEEIEAEAKANNRVLVSDKEGAVKAMRDYLEQGGFYDVREKKELAITFIEDGAYQTAMEILKDLIERRASILKKLGLEN